MAVSYYLVLVGFGSGFTGLTFVYLTDIFYETGMLCFELSMDPQSQLKSS